jgi:uncharacterized protein (TIGR00725 family)
MWLQSGGLWDKPTPELSQTMDYNKHMNRGKESCVKICVSGAAETDCCGKDALQVAERVGAAIAKNGCVMMDGATTGFPHEAAKGAKRAGGVVIGFSPALDEGEHVKRYGLPLEHRDVIIYTGFGYAGRNLILTRAADAVVVGCGRMGTVNEFTHAFEDRKPIGVLEGEWKTDELLKSVLENSSRAKEMEGKIIFETDPDVLVAKLVEAVKNERMANGSANVK